MLQSNNQSNVGKGKKRTTAFVELLARFGCISTAIVYIMIGVVALLSLLRLKHGGADEASILKFLDYWTGYTSFFLILVANKN